MSALPGLALVLSLGVCALQSSARAAPADLLDGAVYTASNVPLNNTALAFQRVHGELISGSTGELFPLSTTAGLPPSVNGLAVR